MTIFRDADAVALTERVRPSDTSITDIIPTLSNNAGLRSVNVCNTTGSAVNATIDIYDGTTAHELISAKSIGANDVYIYENDVLLNAGDSLRVTDGTGNALHFTATYLVAQEDD